VRIPTPKKIPPSLKEYSVGQLSKDYLPIITTTTTTTTTYTHLILATLSFYFWPMPIFFCRMPNFMRPALRSVSLLNNPQKNEIIIFENMTLTH
jgi:hypothetical protein